MNCKYFMRKPFWTNQYNIRNQECYNVWFLSGSQNVQWFYHSFISVFPFDIQLSRGEGLASH